MALDRTTALSSASQGMCQIMGANHTTAGFTALEDFITAMFDSEGAPLDAFIAFIQHAKLDVALRAQD